MALQTQTLHITGMSCSHCVRGVQEALARLDGVEVENVEIGTAQVRYDDSRTTQADLAKALEEEGYALAA